MSAEMFETRSDAWAAVGLNLAVNQKVVQEAKRRLAICLPLLIAAIIGRIWAHNHINWVWQHVKPVHTHHWVLDQGEVDAIATVLVLVLGWMISRDLSRLTPTLFRRLDPAVAGTVEFLIRLTALAVTVLLALWAANVSAQTFAVGGAFTAVIVGLAAQQTLGNLFAGIVLLTVRPFKLGERVRLQAGALGGQIEGIISSLGLMYTTLARGDDRVMVPNTQVLAAAVVPLREPEAVDVKVRLPAGIRPSQVQDILDANVSTPTRSAPTVNLEEIENDGVTVRVRAIPDRRVDGAALADEIILALQAVTGEHAVPTPQSESR
jgi:small-conductance mechanosensitive channel